ncbi:hypothetical protein [Streptococcus sp. HMSC10E12]|uniref:hypothetical protein n=1 Tax=Streptococcus sp. HMSC10E12 TaxID=1581080 RepID=UPI0008A362BF|nr:hypothetical protein [Streptococcus sp. HMSC10E12]OFU82952.1 hypothetical protein HMPREF3112_09150 [Streptococcus sp. HMSC10E12]
MENTTLRSVLSQLEGNAWQCNYMVTNTSLDKTTSGSARLIFYNDNLLIKWDNEYRLEYKVGAIPVSSFSKYQNVEYDGRTLTIITSKWEMYFTF